MPVGTVHGKAPFTLQRTGLCAHLSSATLTDVYKRQREEIYSLIREIVAQGNSVILLGDTLDECIGMATRIIVLRDGLIRAEFDASVENKPSQVDVVSHMM